MFINLCCLFEKKEVLVIISVSVLYITYYLVEVVKRPLVVCGRHAEFARVVRALPAVRERFWPAPWCVEARLQTVLASVLRSCLLPHVRFERQVVRLPDGGQLALDWAWGGEGAGGAEGAGGGARAVLVVLPGLTGSSRADYVRVLAGAARALRAHLVVYHHRGGGGLPLTSRRLYSAVSHDDVRAALAAVRARAGALPLLAVGVSLGGLLLGQLLARHGPAADVQAALVVSAPLDVVKASECIERPILNALLSYHMARNLIRASAALAALDCEDESEGRGEGEDESEGEGASVRWAEVRRCRSVRAFDAAFTAPHCGFASAAHYYRAATLADKLPRVAAPLLCLCAADDPFQPLEALPLEAVRAGGALALCAPARGGHIGFLEAAPRAHYLARLAAQYFAALLERPALLHRPH